MEPAGYPTRFLQSARCQDLLGGEKLLPYCLVGGSTRNHYLIQSGFRKIETDLPHPNLVKAYTVSLKQVKCRFSLRK
ncbi:MAG: hypothetical protein KME25_23790 [Symplocastrum torsivum CPER-KK1]|uniref:Uncharacterized protein n=1 Tax=Symplocastrum torsivum CPER-KK1 TaxID=450513 RepID=A0A951PQH2_9CYAN|nr:hypothetical protein [Symplocastrum torsivum CPER-KK1]